MSSITIHGQAKPYMRSVPDIQPGYTVRVHERVQEGEKERIQIFEGLVISVHKGHVATDASFVVRKIVSGVGVEKVFPLHSPVIEKIEVKKVAKTRRAKLFFVRGRTGKSARMIERFTTENEFASSKIEAPEEVVAEEAVAPAEVAVEASVEAAPAAETSQEQTAA
jgi:large subunit ribosomal protein L19